jgi:hypothetical protein
MVIVHSFLYVYQRVFPRNLSFLNLSPSNIHLVELFLTLPRVGLELHDCVGDAVESRIFIKGSLALVEIFRDMLII